MNTTKYIGVALVAGLLVFFAGFIAKKPTVVNTIQEIQKGEYGAVTGPSLPFPCIDYGGVRRCTGRMESLTQATTTVCAIQSPAATSTLVSGGIKTTTGSTTASTYTLAVSNTAFATTTLIKANVIPANNTAFIVVASSTQTIFAPNQWFVVGISGGSGTFSNTGTCQATWEQI